MKKNLAMYLMILRSHHSKKRISLKKYTTYFLSISVASLPWWLGRTSIYTYYSEFFLLKRHTVGMLCQSFTVLRKWVISLHAEIRDRTFF